MTDRAPVAGPLRVLLTSTSSDAHSWNLVVLELALRETSAGVCNLGPCAPDDLVIATARRERPELIVVSSVNGHGFLDGLRLVGRLRPAHPGADIIIGGKLGITGQAHAAHTAALLAAGFDAVFEGGSLNDLAAYVADLNVRRAAAAAGAPVRRPRRPAEREAAVSLAPATRGFARARLPHTVP